MVAAVAAGLGAGLLAACSDDEPARAALRLAQAPARPTPVAPAGSADPVALAGARVLAARTKGRTVRLAAVGRDGRPAGAPLATFRAPEGTEPQAMLSASASAVGLVVRTRIPTEDEVALTGAQAFVGAPGGPLRSLGPFREPGPAGYYPASVQVDGTRIFVTRHRGSGSTFETPEARHFTMAGPTGALQALDLPAAALDPVFAGDLVAYTVDESRNGGLATRVVVRDWRTGAERWSARRPGLIGGLDLRPDGVVVAQESDPSVKVIFPRVVQLRSGGSARVVARGARMPVWAGTSIVFARRLPGRAAENAERLAVAGAGGRVRAFGVPTKQVWSVVADGRRVLWNANGCVLVADLRAAATAGPARGPCPRGELIVDRENSGDEVPQPVLGRDRIVRVPLRCVAAAPQGCRGRVVSLRYPTEPKAFRIPVGALRRVPVRLTPRGYAEVLRIARSGNGTSFGVRASTTDPAGRRSILDAPSLNVQVRGAR